jgi:GNAT superfamily N-acetyltransferase
VDAGRDALVAFLRRVTLLSATDVATLPYGAGLFNPAIPDVWDANLVWVDRVAGGLTSNAVIADAERLHEAAGTAHRQVVVGDDRGAALASGLETAGYAGRSHLLMVQRRQPSRGSSTRSVEELDVEDIVRFSEAGLRSDPEPLSEAAIEQILEFKRILGRTGTRFFGVRYGGRLVSACDLHLDSAMAQIEAVLTLPQHRNRGHARTVILHAAQTARAAGARLVFLQAEEDDWPKQLYDKLGFDAVGTLRLFLRRPPSR